MKTPAEIDKAHHAFEKRFQIPIRGLQQGSDAWFQVKLGVVSMSNISKAVAKKDSDTRATYMAHLIAQVCTGVIEEQNFKQTEWGKQMEGSARSAYEFAAGAKMTLLGFVFKDESFRIGCSPDGIIGGAKPSEIKTPWDSTNYIKFLLDGVQKPEWKWQNQGTLWVMDADEMDVTHYDVRMKTKPLHTIIVKRDPEMQKKLDDLVPEFIADMDKLLAQIGVKFGEQWFRIAAENQDAPLAGATA